MKFCILASGSKGNSTLIEVNNQKYLIDLGTTNSNIESKLKELSINPREIKGIFLTHTHSDHISALPIFIKKYHTKLYLSEKMNNYFQSNNIYYDNLEIVNRSLELDQLKIEIISLSHDSSDIKGFIFNNKDKSIVYITDTGYINVRHHNKLLNKDAYIIESNHDIEKLMNGKYPYHLKTRILSDKGHLSNNQASKYLTTFIGPKTKEIVLIHLSEENNTEQKALETLLETLNEKNIKPCNISLAKQREKTEMIEI